MTPGLKLRVLNHLVRYSNDDLTLFCDEITLTDTDTSSELSCTLNDSSVDLQTSGPLEEAEGWYHNNSIILCHMISKVCTTM